MSLAVRREEALAAEAETVLHHQRLRSHLDGFSDVRRALFTPFRIVLGGVAAGFAVGTLVPALRRSRVREDIRNGTDAIQRVLAVIRSALPLAVPLWAAISARKAQQASEESAAQAQVDASS